MKYLKLELQSESKKSSHALAGANLRKELKHRYPNTKFKVTTESYSGGSSVRVKYENGAKSDDVQALVNKYVYGRFDSSSDMYEYDQDSTDEYGDVKYGFVDRRYTKEKYEEAIKEENANVELLHLDNTGAYITGDYNDECRVYRNLSEKGFNE